MMDITQYISLEEVTGPGLVYPPGVLDLVTASWPVICPFMVDAHPIVVEMKEDPGWFPGCVIGLVLTVGVDAIPQILGEVRKWQAKTIKILLKHTEFAGFCVEWADGNVCGIPRWDVQQTEEP